MAKTLSYTAAEEDAGMRLDALAALRELYPSRSIAARYIEEGKLFINGEVSTKKYIVSPGDFIVYETVEPPTKTKLVGQDIPLDIRYEDSSLLVLSKQAGLVCHPSQDHFDSTLVNALIFHCGIENLSNVQGENDRLGIVHRLDMDTSGLMLAAKTDEAGELLMAAIRDHEVDRRYLTLVHGTIAHNTGMVNAPIARSPKERTRMTVLDSDSSRESVTTFTVLERFEAGPKDDGFTLLECKLYTGRTHQIRVHMKYIGHPCVGDQLYGSNPTYDQLGLSRQFLHSYLLEFDHPILAEHLSFIDALPQDLQGALDLVSNRSTGSTREGAAVLKRIADLT